MDHVRRRPSSSTNNVSNMRVDGAMGYLYKYKYKYHEKKFEGSFKQSSASRGEARCNYRQVNRAVYLSEVDTASDRIPIGRYSD
jgi:hypothetical protein